MNDDLDRRALRGAIYRRDSVDLMRLLAGPEWPDDALQLLGEAVLVVAVERGQEVADAGIRCARELSERDWAGDTELINQIEAALGWGPVPPLRPLPVDLNELADVLEGSRLSGGGRIDLRTGVVWPQDALEESELDEEQDDDEGERWLWVECEGSRAAYRDMEIFTDDVEDRHMVARLERALRGRGAFRRFKDELMEDPELEERWYGFSDERKRGRARVWLADAGFAPASPMGEIDGDGDA